MLADAHNSWSMLYVVYIQTGSGGSRSLFARTCVGVLLITLKPLLSGVVHARTCLLAALRARYKSKGEQGRSIEPI